MTFPTWVYALLSLLMAITVCPLGVLSAAGEASFGGWGGEVVV